VQAVFSGAPLHADAHPFQLPRADSQSPLVIANVPFAGHGAKWQSAPSLPTTVPSGHTFASAEQAIGGCVPSFGGAGGESFPGGAGGKSGGETQPASKSAAANATAIMANANFILSPEDFLRAGLLSARFWFGAAACGNTFKPFRAK